jgi:hypothetical protein
VISFPDVRWRTFPCYGGWYWEVFRDGAKVNGGLCRSELHAQEVALRQCSLTRMMAVRGVPEFPDVRFTVHGG